MAKQDTNTSTLVQESNCDDNRLSTPAESITAADELDRATATKGSNEPHFERLLEDGELPERKKSNNNVEKSNQLNPDEGDIRLTWASDCNASMKPVS